MGVRTTLDFEEPIRLVGRPVMVIGHQDAGRPPAFPGPEAP